MVLLYGSKDRLITAPASFLRVNLLLQFSDVWKGPVTVSVIQAIAHHPDIGNFEAKVIERDIQVLARFSDQNAGVK